MRFLISVAAILALFTAQKAAASVPPDVPRVVAKAVQHYWIWPRRRQEAYRVIRCETGGIFNTTASNGQYLGLFQMGSHERATYGHGTTADAQARAAHKYFMVTGQDWSPWECQP